VADDDRCADAGRAGPEAAFSLRNTGFRWLVRGDRKLSARGRKDFRKLMLYPLSYEGLACTFAQQAGRVLIRWTQAGYLASDGPCRAPWGNVRPVPPTRGA
jgi:hypothetical protein